MWGMRLAIAVSFFWLFTGKVWIIWCALLGEPLRVIGAHREWVEQALMCI